MSIADTYRQMSEDISRAAKETDNEAVARAYLALAELWSKAALRADASLPLPVVEYVIPD